MQNWTDIFFTSRDGLRLYGRHYPAAAAGNRPLVCLAGLTRNSRDFHDLASALAAPGGRGRDVYTMDYRGRGRSQYDPNWKNYSVLAELNDVLDFMVVKGLDNAAVIGTSRGGIIAMLMAILRPTTLGAVVLNDIGPVIERDGLTRITAYVGRIPLPATWAEAAAIVQDLNQRQFPAVTAGQWKELARQVFNDDNGLPTQAYDPALAKTLSQMHEPIPALWPQFAALSRVPVLTLRGEHSDILSKATVEEMRRRHPRLETITVPGQGHAPLLKDRPSIDAIADFLARTDRQETAESVFATARARGGPGGAEVMDRTFALAVGGALVTALALSFVFHGLLLGPEYNALLAVYRGPQLPAQMMVLMLTAQLIRSAAMVAVFRRGLEARSFLGQGLRFGLLAAGLSVVPFYLIGYVVTNIPASLAIEQIVFETIITSAMGIVIAWAHR